MTRAFSGLLHGQFVKKRTKMDCMDRRLFATVVCALELSAARENPDRRRQSESPEPASPRAAVSRAASVTFGHRRVPTTCHCLSRARRSIALKPFPSTDICIMHGGPFGRRDRDRAPAVGAAPVLARTRPVHPRDRPSSGSIRSLVTSVGFYCFPR